jgi:hypothetical protein
MTDHSIHRGLSYIDLPTNPTGAAPSNASMIITSDKRGVHIDPHLSCPLGKPRKGTAHSSEKASSVSLLPSCTTLAVVKDPRGKQRLVAAGRWPDADDEAGDREKDDQEMGYTRDWWIVSETLPEGTIFQPNKQGEAGSVLAGCAIPSPTAQYQDQDAEYSYQ